MNATTTTRQVRLEDRFGRLVGIINVTEETAMTATELAATAYAEALALEDAGASYEDRAAAWARYEDAHRDELDPADPTVIAAEAAERTELVNALNTVAGNLAREAAEPNADTAPTTCTVGPRADTGARCGNPAVATFTGRDGLIYAECSEHAAPTPAPKAELAVGDAVTVRHAGLTKPGTVVKVGPVNVAVTVATYGGKFAKVINRRRDEVTPR